MKIKRGILFLLLIVAIISCSTFETSTIYDKRVRYFTSTILNADRDIITLQNNTVWQVDHLTTFANLSPVLVVLDENINVGDMYVGNQKYRIHGGMEEDFFYKNGYLQIMKDYDSTHYVIALLNNSKWEIPKAFSKAVKKWINGSEIVITEDEHFFINCRKQEKVPVRRIRKSN